MRPPYQPGDHCHALALTNDMNPPTHVARLCLDGGPSHSWHGTGLDVTRPGVLAHTARCVWCDRTATRPVTATSKPIRDGVRVRP